MLLDLVEPQEGILGAELVLQRVEEDLVLRHLWLPILQRLVDSDRTTPSLIFWPSRNLMNLVREGGHPGR